MSGEARPANGALDHHRLSANQRRQLACVLQTLEADGRAPTAVREPEQAARIHLADSLAALELDAVRAATRVADIGSGAGFPGVALAVALDSARVGLIESQRRRCVFLERLCADARIENARVVCARVEEWLAGLSAHDLVVARALAAQPVVLEYAAPLLQLEGTLVDWRGRRDHEQEDAAARAARMLGLERVEIHRVEPFEGAKDHHLHVFTKTHETPERFPRRAGMARKRPLGA